MTTTKTTKTTKTATISVEQGACGRESGYRAVVHESAGANRVYVTTIYPSRERAVIAKAYAAQWATAHGYSVA
jgi:hypothetical protein